MSQVVTLYSDKEKTNALYPRTKISAISDDNNTPLKELMTGMVKQEEGGIEAVKSIGKLLWNVVRHPERTLKQVKTLGRLSKDATTKGTKYIKRTANKVIKQITAKKRIKHALKQAHDNREILN